MTYDRDDMVLVPREPTEAMKMAAFDVCEIAPGTNGFRTGTEARNAIYRAMVNASPTPSAGKDEIERLREQIARIIDPEACKHIDEMRVDWAAYIADVAGLQRGPRKVDVPSVIERLAQEEAAGLKARRERTFTKADAILAALHHPNVGDKIATDVRATASPQPAGGATPPSPQAVLAKGAHQAQGDAE